MRLVCCSASLVEKDLHDVSMEVLREQLDLPLSAKEWQDPDLISPRVMLEHLYPVQQEALCGGKGNSVGVC